ncbi:MAG: helix-turn-helix domain-containing protein [Chloroflexota bacterium]|nr:helix-turn-helix domain-containing protein [Chloroflexota bacterium]
MSTASASSNKGRPVVDELDDIDAHVATFDEAERRDLAAAEAAIDIAILLHRARERRGLSQTMAAKLAGLQQQAVSRFEQPAANPRLDTVQAYLGALGYGVEIRAIDLETGEPAATAILPPPRSRRSPRVRSSKMAGRGQARSPHHRRAEATRLP